MWYLMVVTRLGKKDRRLVDDDHEEYHKCDNREKTRFARPIWVEISELAYRGGKYGYVHLNTPVPLWAGQSCLDCISGSRYTGTWVRA